MNIEVKNAHTRIKMIISEVKKSVIGKDDVITKVLLAMAAGGHILIEDIPGVGKTTMALAFSKAMSLNYNRMQFTPDVLPTDITGFSLYNKDTGKFDFKPGVAVCNLFLADEINRTSSKTQSALLEIMEEGSITVDGKTVPLPDPFVVIATQNPVGSIGTQMLPESQLDRFMIKVNMGYPDVEREIDILKTKLASSPEERISIKPVAAASDMVTLRDTVSKIYIDDKIFSYIARLADATRRHPMISLGLSPRGTLSLASMSRAVAVFIGRDYVIPDDVAVVFHDVAQHRIMLERKAVLSDMNEKNVLDEILRNVSVPELND
ncbi:MAG: MoxR family ATPase [Clostridium sp.]|nr:MoxR family ATPase [Clostridium sp.]